MVYYELIAQCKYDSTIGQYNTYGIQVIRSGRIVSIVEDICLDRHKVEALTKLYNKERLSPSQLSEAIEDFLVDFEV